MSSVLSLLGAASAVIGVVLVAFGVPVREAAFGNTLILGGIVSIVGGLIMFGLGAAAAQLNRISEALALRPLAPQRPNRPMETLEAPQTPLPALTQRAPQPQQADAPARFPFPPKQRAEQPYAQQRTPQGQDESTYYDERPAQFAPMLRNPDEPFPGDFDEAPLSPPMPYPSRAPEHFEARQPYPVNGSGRGEKHHEPVAETAWRQPQAPARQTERQPQPAYFDAMWPAPEPRAPKSAEQPKPRVEMPRAERPEPAVRPEPPMPAPARQEQQAPRPDLAIRAEALREHAQAAQQPRRAEPKPPEQPKPPPAAENRAVAILKSGVVDGMGYTLYVDGSIEATLPQGTLRFASINELRTHLEKNS
jgi:hypothetical protein